MSRADPSAARVASVPSAHPYVAHLGATVTLLPDPPVPGAPAGQWWPPQVLHPDWIGANAGAFDLVHTHFGLEGLPPAQLSDALAALRAAGKPVVHTVHDLENPQLADQGAHDAALDVLLASADALLTLTPGAAAAVLARCGRAATVVPHPHVHPLDAPLPAGRAGGAARIGVHLRALRPNVDGPGTTATLLGAARRLGGSVGVQVHLHRDVRDEAARDEVRALCAGVPWATVVEAARPGDAALAAGLAELHAVVLPYRHGTHSGWLELCWDLGVPVAVPADVGCIAQQHPDASVASWRRGDAPGLAAALERLLAAGTAPGSTARRTLQADRRDRRRRQAPAIAAAHDAVYRRVLSEHRR